MVADQSQLAQADLGAPQVSIIIASLNGAQWLPRCLEALFAQTERSFEVIVVDDASTDGSTDNLDSRWPGVRVIRMAQRSGFQVTNNQGARQARGRWIVLLNNDAFPQPDWLEKLLAAIRQHPDYAVFSSCLVQANQPDRLDNTGDLVHVSGAAWHRGFDQPVETAVDYPPEVFCPNGAAALYLREAYLEAGGLDERYFNHHDDVDLGFRLRLLGYPCRYVPEAVVHHIGSATFGGQTDQTVYNVQRNMVWTYFKDMPGWLVWKYLPVHLLVNLVFLLYYVRKGQGRTAWRAKRDAYLGLPETLRQRKEIQKNRRISPAELDCLLEHNWLSPFLLGKWGQRLRKTGKRRDAGS